MSKEQMIHLLRCSGFRWDFHLAYLNAQCSQILMSTCLVLKKLKNICQCKFMFVMNAHPSLIGSKTCIPKKSQDQLFLSDILFLKTVVIN